MNFKEVQSLIKLVSESELKEIKVKEGDFEIVIRNKNYCKNSASLQNVMQPMMMAPNDNAPAAPNIAMPPPTTVPQDATSAEPKNQESSSNLLEVKSPIVGTFYRSSGPDKPPFVSVGDTISEGSVVCIVEAMKLFNEIESEISGKIVKVMIDDASPVEYDQVLFLIDPNA